MDGFSFAGFIDEIGIGIFGLVYLALYISNSLLGLFNFADSVLKIWFGRESS